jgi:hypothetical protein
MLLAACPKNETGADGGQPIGEWPLDTILGEGEVRCGPVTKPSELIGGPLAYGQVGHSFRCHNARIRFLVQGEKRPFGNSSYGGNLIDIDWVRDSEAEDGHDAFREFVVAYGVQEVQVDAIEIANDGRNGKAGKIRVSGHLATLSLAPQAAYLSQELPVYVQTDYILDPDVDFVAIETTLINESDEQLFSVMYADFVAFGGVNQTLSPIHGFDSVPLFSDVPFLASGGSDVSYSYICSDGDPLIIFAEGGITLPVCRDDGIVVESATYTRYIAVGDGTIESASRKAYAIKGSPSGLVTGQVRNAAGEPVANAFVSAVLGVSIDDPGAVTANRTKTDASGTYELTLAPGQYHVVAFESGEGRSEAISLILESSSTEQADLELPAKGTLIISTRFLDRAGESLDALPAKLSVQPLENGYVPNGVLGEFEKHGLVRSVGSTDGNFQLSIIPGTYRLYVTRGFEFSRYQSDITLVAGATEELQAEISHVLNTDGYVGAEFHQHTLASTDSDVPLGVKVLENASEGIEFAASTDHDNISDFTPYVQAQGLENHLVVIPGNEVSYQSIGHFNVYPWNIDPEDPFRDVGTRIWWQKTVPELFDHVSELAGNPIVQLNHPRSSSAGMLGALRFNPATGSRYDRGEPQLPSLPDNIYQEWPTQFQAIEVNNNLGTVQDYTLEGYAEISRRAEDDPGDVPALADYFGLLGSGMAIAAMGNSDTHDYGEGTGYPRNFVRVQGSTPPDISADAVREAIALQRVAVGEGCLIELKTDTSSPMGLAEMISASELDSLRVVLQAPPHVTLEKLEIYQNGMAQSLVQVDGQINIQDGGSLSLELAQIETGDTVKRLDTSVGNLSGDDFILLALARGGSGLSPTGGGAPFCFSAPLYVDMDGDNLFQPWLAATQTIVPEP